MDYCSKSDFGVFRRSPKMAPKSWSAAQDQTFVYCGQHRNESIAIAFCSTPGIGMFGGHHNETKVTKRRLKLALGRFGEGVSPPTLDRLDSSQRGVSLLTTPPLSAPPNNPFGQIHEAQSHSVKHNHLSGCALQKTAPQPRSLREPLWDTLGDSWLGFTPVKASGFRDQAWDFQS